MNWLDKHQAWGYRGVNTCLRVGSTGQRRNSALQCNKRQQRIKCSCIFSFFIYKPELARISGSAKDIRDVVWCFKDQVKEEGNLSGGKNNG
jgi:hypothetical protein